MAEVERLLGLRCPHCGGPLPKTKKKLAECKYCGTPVRIDDATQYLDHLKGFVVDWIRTALPGGINFAYSTSVDPVARHNIFVQNVSPSLNSEFSGVQFDALQCFSTPLIAPPFVATSFPKTQRSAKSLFSFNAKVSSVQPLAVTQEDEKTVQKIEGLSRAFAHILIALDLMEKTKDGSYKTVAENFAAAAKALESAYETQSKRMSALAETYLSIDDLLSKKEKKSRKRINQAKSLLEEVKFKSTHDIDFSICIPAIEQELEVARTVSLVVDLVESYPRGKLLEIVGKVENLFKTMSTATKKASKNWLPKFENMERYSEVMKWTLRIFEAKKGKSAIRVASGSGGILFPFWTADINYTFSTGSLWMRKGRSVTETALIAATFPLFSEFEYSPSDVVTDIFEKKPSGVLNSFVGREISISIGEHIRKLTCAAQLRSAANYTIVPPLTTPSEAEQLMNEYLQQVAGESRGKLQVASSKVSDLIFVPADLTPSSINFHETLGWSAPKRVGDIQKINSIAI